LNGHRQGQPHGHGPEDRVPPAEFGQSHGGPSSLIGFRNVLFYHVGPLGARQKRRFLPPYLPTKK
jgi:hypothetical protein